jgi:hypothetical protein
VGAVEGLEEEEGGQGAYFDDMEQKRLSARAKVLVSNPIIATDYVQICSKRDKG